MPSSSRSTPSGQGGTRRGGNTRSCLFTQYSLQCLQGNPIIQMFCRPVLPCQPFLYRHRSSSFRVSAGQGQAVLAAQKGANRARAFLPAPASYHGRNKGGIIRTRLVRRGKFSDQEGLGQGFDRNAGEFGGAVMGVRLVLVGGGHAHLETLKHAGNLVRGGHRVTLINPSPYHYYSGMGPGMLSGMYRPLDVRFNVKKMAEDGGGTFMEARVTRILPASRTLLLETGKTVEYDIASFNIGSDVPVALPRIDSSRVIPVKPIINLYRARESILEAVRSSPVRIVVAGGGAAGVEVAANVWRLVREAGKAAQIVLIGGRRILSGFPSGARRLALASLARKGIVAREGVWIRSTEERHIRLSDGDVIPHDFVLLATGVTPSRLFRDSGLPVEDGGWLSVDPFLRCVGHPNLLGGGDCVSMAGHGLSKVGVHAVRQGEVLRHNLAVALNGGAMRQFSPQRRYLLILNMGDGRGILCRGGWVWEGRSAFLLKRYLDNRFMRKYQVPGDLRAPSEGPASGP